MLNKLSSWLRKKSTGWLVIGSLIIMLLFTILVLPSQAEVSRESTGSTTSPDTSLYYSPEDLYKIAEIYGPDGRQAYIYARWTFDLIFPLVYVSFLAIGLSWFSKQLNTSSKIWNLVNLIPLLSGLLDYLENSAPSLVMYLYPARLNLYTVKMEHHCSKFYWLFLLWRGNFDCLVKKEKELNQHSVSIIKIPGDYSIQGFLHINRALNL